MIKAKAKLLIVQTKSIELRKTWYSHQNLMLPSPIIYEDFLEEIESDSITKENIKNIRLVVTEQKCPAINQPVISKSGKIGVYKYMYGMQLFKVIKNGRPMYYKYNPNKHFTLHAFVKPNDEVLKKYFKVNKKLKQLMDIIIESKYSNKISIEKNIINLCQIIS